ncbi:hypothetical protein SO802_002450 [Lithocarpus litseifolius]|uniref:Uncharacterized protein n=1 Tax=Lithocarpus litseifolius TaxID=425828 RepID=A0AAW2E2W3_9ROSI
MEHDEWRPAQELGGVRCLTPFYLHTLTLVLESGYSMPSARSLSLVPKPKPGRELVEDLTWSLKSELSAHSPTEEEEEYIGDEGDGEEGKEGEEEGEDFYLSLIWTVNDFYPTKSQKVFDTLLDRYQIPEHIPFQLPRMFERCYLGKTTDVGMYDAMFTMGLRLPLTELHH